MSSRVEELDDDVETTNQVAPTPSTEDNKVESVDKNVPATSGQKPSAPKKPAAATLSDGTRRKTKKSKKNKKDQDEKTATPPTTTTTTTSTEEHVDAPTMTPLDDFEKRKKEALRNRLKSQLRNAGNTRKKKSQREEIYERQREEYEKKMEEFKQQQELQQQQYDRTRAATELEAGLPRMFREHGVEDEQLIEVLVDAIHKKGLQSRDFKEKIQEYLQDKSPEQQQAVLQNLTKVATSMGGYLKAAKEMAPGGGGGGEGPATTFEIKEPTTVTVDRSEYVGLNHEVDEPPLLVQRQSGDEKEKEPVTSAGEKEGKEEQQQKSPLAEPESVEQIENLADIARKVISEEQRRQEYNAQQKRMFQSIVSQLGDNVQILSK